MFRHLRFQISFISRRGVFQSTGRPFLTESSPPGNRKNNIHYHEKESLLTQLMKNAAVPILGKFVRVGFGALCIYGIYRYTVYSYTSKATQAYDSVKAVIVETKDALADTLTRGKDYMKEKVNEAVEGGKKTAESLSTTVQDGLEGGTKAMGSAFSIFSDGINGTKETVNKAVEAVSNGAKDVTERMNEAAETGLQYSKEKLDALKGILKSKTQSDEPSPKADNESEERGSTNSFSDKLNRTQEAIRNKFDEKVDQLKGKREEVKSSTDKKDGVEDSPEKDTDHPDSRSK